MRKRRHQVIFRLTDDEFERLKKRVADTGLTTEAFLRQLISGRVPRALPPAEYYAMMQEVYDLEQSLDRLRDILLDRRQDVEAAQMELVRREVVNGIHAITSAVLEPERQKIGE